MATSTFYDKIVIDEDAARILADGLSGLNFQRCGGSERSLDWLHNRQRLLQQKEAHNNFFQL